MNTQTRAWLVYGADGHRQRESFSPSGRYNWSKGEDVRIVDVKNADVTGTNDFTIITITRNTAQECEDEFYGQLSDGIFENSTVGKVVEFNRIALRQNEVTVLVDHYNKGFEAGDTIWSPEISADLVEEWDVKDINKAFKELYAEGCSYFYRDGFVDISESALQFYYTDEKEMYVSNAEYVVSKNKRGETETLCGYIDEKGKFVVDNLELVPDKAFDTHFDDEIG